MSWQIWVGGLGLLIALFGAVVGLLGVLHKDEDVTFGGFGTAVVAGGIGIVIVLTGCVTIVGTRQIAIQTSFGKPSGVALNNGLHGKMPWTITHEMDGAIQIDRYTGDKQILIRLGNSSTAKADVSIRWQMKQAAAPELFQQYKTFDNVRINLVERNLAVALNEVFAKYDPLEMKNLQSSPLPGLAARAADILRGEVGQQVDILDVNVPTISYDQDTEGKINAINQQRADTTKALEAQNTARAQAEANRILSDSISNDPNVVTQNCINAVVAKGLSPLGCWPGAAAMPTVPAR